MHIEVSLPLRGQASGGAIKHLTEIIPQWLGDARMESVTVFTRQGMVSRYVAARQLAMRTASAG
jgi:hypothetical protein